MSTSLQVLVVEDSENDALLLELELQRAGYDPHCHRVETPDAMHAALARQAWDLVIADYVMPHFNGLAALALVKQLGLDLPFIVVSGHITDATAVAAMRAGAHDYVMKDNLSRLGSAVDRELREAEIRRERRRAEDQLKAESAFRQAIEQAVPAGITAIDQTGRLTYVNPAFRTLVGWSEADLLNTQPPFAFWPPHQADFISRTLAQAHQGGTGPTKGLELPYRRRDGQNIAVFMQSTPLKDASGAITGWVSSVLDITERKQAELRLAAEHAITRILANAPSVDEAAPGIVQELLRAGEVDLGGFWLVDSARQLLFPCALDLRLADDRLRHFVDASRHLTFTPGAGLPGQVWASRQVLWLPDLASSPQCERREKALQAGLRSAVGFPIQTAGDFFGVLEFFTARRLDHEPTLLNMLTAIASEIGQFIQRRRAEDALRRAHDELEIRVQQRTADLKQANARLQTAIAERQRLEHELLEITEKERRRIGLDLHDDLGQKLSGIALMTKGLELRLAKLQSDAAQDAGRIHTLVTQAMNHASDLAGDLATLDLKENNLPTALADLAAHTRDLFQIACRSKVEGDIPPLDRNTVGQLYKIAQEAVTNAIKHGQARRVDLQLLRDSDQLILTIRNNGLPFPDLHSVHTGMGLRIMNYRASLVGATLEIKAAGTRGTLVTCRLPVAAAGGNADPLKP